MKISDLIASIAHAPPLRLGRGEPGTMYCGTYTRPEPSALCARGRGVESFHEFCARLIAAAADA